MSLWNWVHQNDRPTKSQLFLSTKKKLDVCLGLKFVNRKELKGRVVKVRVYACHLWIEQSSDSEVSILRGLAKTSVDEAWWNQDDWKIDPSGLWLCLDSGPTLESTGVFSTTFKQKVLTNQRRLLTISLSVKGGKSFAVWQSESPGLSPCHLRRILLFQDKIKKSQQIKKKKNLGCFFEFLGLFQVVLSR